MGHIKREFITVAKGRSKVLAAHLLTLSRFAVVGVMTQMEFECVCSYLKDIGAKFKTNKNMLIWLEVLPVNLQNFFLKNKHKLKNKSK